MTKIISDGQTVDFEAAVNLMDNDLREELAADLGSEGVSEQEFFALYCLAHAERFGELFVVN